MDFKAAISTDCQLIISPLESDLELGQIYVEYMLGDDVDPKQTVYISEGDIAYKFPLPKDGFYIYTKLKVILSSTEPVISEGQNTQQVWVKQTGNPEDPYKFMIHNPITGVSEEVSKQSDFENISKYWDLQKYNIIRGKVKEVFSVCRFDNCMMNILKQVVKSNIENCGKDKCSDADKRLKAQRDFLVLSNYVLHSLIREKRYTEAAELRESLNTCGSICPELSNSSGNNDCGCGRHE